MAPKAKAKSVKAGAKGSTSKLPIRSEMFTHVTTYKNSDRWSAWVREPKQGGDRVFLGTHLSERLAARCQDRTLLKLETEPTMTLPIELNFPRTDYAEDEDLRKNMTRAEFIKQLQLESHVKRKPTACLSKFLAEEQALGNIPRNALNNLDNSLINSDDEKIDEESDHGKTTDQEEPNGDLHYSHDVDESEAVPMETETSPTSGLMAHTGVPTVQPVASGAGPPRAEGRRGRGGVHEMVTEDELEVAEFMASQAFRDAWASSARALGPTAAIALTGLNVDPSSFPPTLRRSSRLRLANRR